MAQGFGGSPGVNILIGVARGIDEDRKRRREIEQEAINRRLKEAQITQMAENVRLQEEREARYQAQEANRVAEVEYARNEAEAENLRNEEQMQLAIGTMTQQIMAENPDIDEDLAGYMAYNAVNDLVPYKSPQEAKAEAMTKWQHDVLQEEADEAEKERIINDPEFWEFIKTAPDIASVWEQSYQRGFDRNAASELWADQNRDKPPERFEDYDPATRAMIDRDAAIPAQQALNEAYRQMAQRNANSNGEYFEKLNESGRLSQEKANLAMTLLSASIDDWMKDPDLGDVERWTLLRAPGQLYRLSVQAEAEDIEEGEEDGYMDWGIPGRGG